MMLSGNLWNIWAELEKFYKYGGFDRKIDLSFTVVAQIKTRNYSNV